MVVVKISLILIINVVHWDLINATKMVKVCLVLINQDTFWIKGCVYYVQRIVNIVNQFFNVKYVSKAIV